MAQVVVVGMLDGVAPSAKVPARMGKQEWLLWNGRKLRKETAMAETITIAVALFTLVGCIIGIYSRFSSAIETLSTEWEKKRGRIFERVDEVKKTADNLYTKKEVCILIHEQLKETLRLQSADIKEIRDDLKAFLKANGYTSQS